MAEVDETVKRIQGMKGVKGVLITNNDGIPIKSTVEDPQHLSYVMKGVLDQACRVVKELDSLNDLSMVRLHTKKDEVMCCTDPQSNFMMTVIHETVKSHDQIESMMLQ